MSEGEATWFRQGSFEPDKISQWVMHKPIAASLVLFAAWGVPGMLGDLLPLWVSILSAGGGWYSSYLFLRAQGRHERGLCDRCLQQPLPTDKDVEKHRSKLQFFHWAATHVKVYLGGTLLMVLVTMGLALFVVENPVVKQVFLLLPVYLWMGVTSNITRKHEWMRSQCPFCRRGGGGGGWDRVPNPDPAAANHR
jgi:hypothetical protein